jgi:putative endonuclease
MYYVYILQSLKDQSYYKGFTTDLKTQLAKHNRGGQFFTAQKKPWILVCYFAFNDKHRAAAFERYIKSGSGFAFCKKHFL